MLTDCRSGAASPAGSVTSRSTNHSGSSNSGSNSGSNRSQLVSDVTSGGLKSSSISTYSNSEISTSTSLKSNQAPIGTAIEEYKPRTSRRKEKPTIYLQVIPREVRGHHRSFDGHFPPATMKKSIKLGCNQFACEQRGVVYVV